MDTWGWFNRQLFTADLRYATTVLQIELVYWRNTTQQQTSMVVATKYLKDMDTARALLPALASYFRPLKATVALHDEGAWCEDRMCTCRDGRPHPAYRLTWW